eukprot:TRINITY_DN7130_c0_g1_i1.p1 TRINITY_DN7130_c0_g1~~TRINITY_DN7130_c0_g1_i1.p1  ORF type:complete len:469 (-),score=68.87 TRINITY_DN7130_c0_g1_i1:86-1492(-)
MSTFEIFPEEVELKEVLGAGTFGKVYRGKCRGKDVAIKKLHKPIENAEDQEAFMTEVQTMGSFSHPNICLFMGACVEGEPFIVQEYMPNGDVERLLHDKNVELSLCRRMVMAKDVALGMNWLHCNNPIFIHRDLKSSNLLLDENFRVKVCDFGFSQSKEHGQMLTDSGLKGTPLWMAPEVMRSKAFNEKVDVYSFGIVLWEFLTREKPFAHHSDYERFERAICRGERPQIPADCEVSLRTLMEECWDGDSSERPSFDNIIHHLTYIIVDVAIKDKYGRDFWKKNFLGREEVRWQEFEAKFYEYLGVPRNSESTINSNCLKAILVDRQVKGTFLRQVDPHNVSIENFGDLLQWVGPMVKSNKENDKTVLDNIRELMEKAWFHGDIDTKTSQERLSGRPDGTFLIRFSSIAGLYTISQINSDRLILHQRIQRAPSGDFILDSQSYPSLFALVERRGLTPGFFTLRLLLKL